ASRGGRRRYGRGEARVGRDGSGPAPPEDRRGVRGAPRPPSLERDAAEARRTVGQSARLLCFNLSFAGFPAEAMTAPACASRRTPRARYVPDEDGRTWPADESPQAAHPSGHVSCSRTTPGEPPPPVLSV